MRKEGTNLCTGAFGVFVLDTVVMVVAATMASILTGQIEKN